MAGEEIDGRIIAFILTGIEIQGTRESAGRRLGKPVISFQKTSHVIPVFSIPLRPAGERRKTAHLIKSAGIPGLRNEFHIPENGIFREIFQKRRLIHGGTVFIPSQNTCQIKPESIHMVFNGPVTQAFQDQLLHHRMIAVQRIAAAAEIIIPASRRQHIINPVIKTFKRKDRPFFISFRRMVEHYIQDHLDPAGIQFPDQGFQLISLPVKLFFRGITGVWCKKAHRIIAPVIQKHPAIDFTPSHGFVKLKNGHQLHGCDSKILQIRNFFPDSRKGSRMRHARRSVSGKAPDMELINDQILNRPDRIHMVSPVKIIDHHSGPVFMILIGPFPPDALTRNRPRIRIQKRFGLIKNQAIFRRIGAIYPVSILKIADIQAKYNHGINASDPVVFRKRQHCIGLFFPSVVQKKLHARRFQGRNCKVHALPERRCPVDSIKTGSYLITVDFIQRYEMFFLCCNHLFSIHPSASFFSFVGFLRQNLLPDRLVHEIHLDHSLRHIHRKPHMLFLGRCGCFRFL